jgi:hypothetical protein
VATEAIIEILSATGTVQVTSTGGIGYGLSAVGSVTLTADPQNYPQPMVIASVSVQGQNPVFAFKSAGRINVERVVVSGSTFTFRVRAQSSNPVGLQYWIFDTAAASAKDPTMAGLVAEIRDEYGVVTFDATAAAMRAPESITTPKTPDMIPSGNFVSLTDTQTFSVPSGRVYAVAQSTPSFVFLQHDTGAYSNSQSQPSTGPVLGDEEPPEQFRWRQQALQSYHSTACFIDANTIEVGLTRFENFNLGWRPAGEQPRLDVYGQPRHLIIDVTNFTSAGPVNPTIINVSANATSRTVSTGGATTISQSVTPAVTVSASGGSGSYSYLWQFVSGASEVVANGATNQASFSTSTTNQPQASTRSAIWRCRVTDSNGVVGYGPDVTFSHVAEAYTVDVKLDPIDWADFNVITNENYAVNNHNGQNATGINQPVTLRAYIVNYSGSISDGYVRAYNWNGGNPQFRGDFRYAINGNGSFAFTTNPGEHMYFHVDAATASGRQMASFDVHVYN